MMKYFFVLALLSTVACSGASPDDTSSKNNAVEGKSSDDLEPGTKGVPGTTLPSKEPSASDSGKDSSPPGKGDPGTKPGTKDPGNCPGTVAQVNDGCSDALADLQGLMEKAAASGDNELLAGLKNKYVLTEESCNPPSSQASICDEALANLEGEITKALAVGDTDAVVGFKEKYVATLASCGAPTVVSDNGGEKKPADDSAGTVPEKPITDDKGASLPEKPTPDDKGASLPEKK